MSKKKNKYEIIPAGDTATAVAEPFENETQSDTQPPPQSETERPSKVGRKYEKWLRCNLTEEEKQDAANRLVNRMEDLARKEAELDSIKNQFKGEMARISADIEAAKNLVRDGYEMRDVSIIEERDYETEMMTITRLDTFEVIEERRMRGDELQRPLFD